MRDIEDCTAEVFRRGEKRIRERRRRRSRVLAVCIPVCLIIILWPAVVLSGVLSVWETDSFAQYAEGLAGAAPELLACPYTAVEIQCAGMLPQEHDGRVTDTAAVAEMYRAVNSLLAGADGSVWDADGSPPAAVGEAAPSEADNADLDLSGSTGKSKGHTIIFTAEDGAQAVYHLSENTLVNVNTNETIFLSDAQTAGLLAVLGISE